MNLAFGQRLARTTLLAVAFAGCTSSAPAAAPTAGVSTAPTTQPSAPSPAPPGLTPATEVAANAINVGCSDQSPCNLSAGTWVLAGKYSFILGMKITVPDGWRSLEQDAGEFNLFPVGDRADHFFMVKDIAAVKTDGSLSIVDSVPQTIDGLTGYWQHDRNLSVTKSEPTTIAGGLEAVTLVLRVSPNARFIDTGCPSYPRCADMFTDPRHWGGGVYGIGAPAVVRLYMATVGSGQSRHLIVVGLEAKDEAELARFEDVTAPMIKSITIPAEIAVW